MADFGTKVTHRASKEGSEADLNSRINKSLVTATLWMVGAMAMAHTTSIAASANDLQDETRSDEKLANSPEGAVPSPQDPRAPVTENGGAVESQDRGSDVVSGQDPEMRIDLSPQIQALESIRLQMDSVASSLANADSSSGVLSAQVEILEQLDQLIEADGQSRPAPTNAQQGSSASQGNEANEQSSQTTDGNQENGNQGSGQPDELVTDRMFETAWGHLPERVQEKMRAALGEQFLPKYEKLIEAYYKKLANEDRDRP